MIPEHCSDVADLDPRYIVCVEQVQPSTDWPQLLVNAIGVLVAALVAIWVAGEQHRRQVLQRTRQDVADFLDLADKCANHAHTRRFREQDRHGDVDLRSAQDRLTSKMHVVRLTAPHRVYVLASSVYYSLQTLIQHTEAIMELGASGDEDRHDYREYLETALSEAGMSYSNAVHELVNISVNYSWWARRLAKWKDRYSRAMALRKMRRQGIEGCVDGPSVFDRSL